MRVEEGGDAEGDGDDEIIHVWSPDHQAEVCMRISDFRKAAAGMKRADKGQKNKFSDLQLVPKCSTCHGRHMVKACPNHIAKKDTSYTVGATKCNYHDYQNPSIICNGRGP